MFMTILFYLFSSSAVVCYGLGTNRLVSNHDSFSEMTLSFIKALFVSVGSTVLTYLISRYLLVPVNLNELTMFFAVILFIILSLIIEVFVNIGVGSSPSEFAVPLLSIILALMESISLSESIIIVCFSIISFYMLIGLLFTLRTRIEIFSPDAGLKTYSIILISLAVIIMAFSGFNVSWLNR